MVLPYPLPFFIGGNSSSVQNAMWSHHIISEDRITTVCIVPGSSQCVLKHLFSDLYGLKKKIKSNLIFTSLQCFSAKKDASCLKIRLNAQINPGARNELEKIKIVYIYTHTYETVLFSETIVINGTATQIFLVFSNSFYRT